MPEIPEQVDKERIDQFCSYLDVMSNPPDGLASKALYEKNKDLLLSLSPQEIFMAFTRQLDKGSSTDDILQYLNKIINVLYKGLSSYLWEKPAVGTFLAILTDENQALLALLDTIRGLLRQGNWQDNHDRLLTLLDDLAAFDSHYLKKENILFPSMEKVDSRFNGLSIMWALHDQARSQIRHVRELIREGADDERVFHTLIGQLLFTLHGLVIKENLILFPAASELFTDQELEQMLVQSFDYGFALIEPPLRPTIQALHATDGLLMSTETGSLRASEAILLFNSLPIDLTFVDEHNKVRYFNNAKDRFFPRSPAVIGRDVSRCHPPESVHTVLEIIESFRSGKRDTASFWIRLKGRLILIRYFALRSEEGDYRGVLEVSQDITDIQGIEGERRLLQWDES